MISIIICSIDDAKYRAVSEMYSRVLGSTPFEMIRISDARSMSEGYNRGIAAGRGDILIFSHDDLEFVSPDFSARLQKHLSRFDLIGLAGATRAGGNIWHSAGPPYIFGQVSYPQIDGRITVMIYGAPAPLVAKIQIMDGLFLAMNRRVLEKVRFDESFEGFHFYDLDFTFTAFKMGFKLAVANDIHALHASAGSFGGPQWDRLAAKFQAKWAGHLDALPARPFNPTGVLVQTRAEVLEVTCPQYWKD